MEEITQDFQFNIYTGIYGRFIIQCEENDLTVLTVNSKHPGIRNSYDMIVSIATNQELATLFKLQYGNYLVIRPVPDQEEIDKLGMEYERRERQKTMKERWMEPDNWKTDWARPGARPSLRNR